MPFKINGTFNGKMYSEQPITAEELIATFGLKEILNKKILQIERIEGVKKDAFGKVESQPGLRMEKRRFNATWQGESIHIIWYQTESGRDKTNRIIYTPDRHNWGTATTTTIDAVKNKEEALFFAMHPNNTESPLHVKGRHTPVWKTVDKEKESRRLLETRAQMASIENTILNGEIATLKRNLKSQEGAGSVDAMSDAQIRSAWLQKLENAKRENKFADFVEIFNNPATIIGGLVQDCMDKGIIELYPDPRNSNIKTWRWGQGADKALRNSEILKVTTTNNLDARTQLVYYVLDNAETLGKQLQNASIQKSVTSEEVIKQITAPEVIKEVPTRTEGEELFLMAQARQILTFVPSRKVICFLNDGLVGDLIMEVKDSTNYLQEFDKFIATKKGKDIADLIRQKLAEQFNKPQESK